MNKPTKVQREAEANFAKLNAKWDKLYGKVTLQSRRPAEMPVLKPPPGREQPVYASLSTPGGSTSKAIVNKYTGTSMLGVATMHKSNMVPIFSNREATEVATMRRN